jgi:hypothetical protein
MRVGNVINWLKERILLAMLLVLAVALISAIHTSLVYADPDPVPKNPPAKSSISGAGLYAVHCSRCHTERYATEFTLAHWKTIMIHMRVRANIPADQARQIMEYLQENSGR